MNFPEIFLKAILPSGVFLAVFVWLLQFSIGKLLDQKMENFKQQLQIDTKIRELLLKSQIEFRERQLGDFYGPIYARLKRGKPINRLWKKDKLEVIDASITDLFASTNDAIVEIILNRSHLVDGAEIPESFTGFLTHVAIWHGYMATPHKGLPLSKKEFPEAYYPVAFEEEIFATTERLKRELSELHGRYGLLAKSEA